MPIPATILIIAAASTSFGKCTPARTLEIPIHTDIIHKTMPTGHQTYNPTIAIMVIDSVCLLGKDSPSFFLAIKGLMG